MGDWDCVASELALWGDSLPPARLWLRDDDAFEPTGELEQLGQMTKQYHIPLTLAVVPKPATEILENWTRDNQHISIALHGYSHTNHAPPSAKKCELGLHRGKQIVLEELARGLHKLEEMFGNQFVQMLVPPWNRIDDELITSLPDIGLDILSTYGWCQQVPEGSDLAQINTHVDIIDWKGNRGGRATSDLASELAIALSHARSIGGAPVGILSHHLVHDRQAWSFLEQLFNFTKSQKAIEWRRSTELAQVPNL